MKTNHPYTWLNRLLALGSQALSTPAFSGRFLAGACLFAATTVETIEAHAQTVGVQFFNGGTSLAPTQMAGLIPQSHFNIVTTGYGLGAGHNYGTYTTGSLLNSDGVSSGITLTHTSHDGWITGTDTGTANGNLLHFEDKTGGNVGDLATYTFNNLAAASYNLIAYIESDQTVNANITSGRRPIMSSTKIWVAAPRLSSTPTTPIPMRVSPATTWSFSA